MRRRSLESTMLSEASSHESCDQEKSLRPTVRTIKRSTHERKDRVARENFTEDLRGMEIAFLERKQKFKPRGMKEELIEANLYETVKTICRLPDSGSSFSRGNLSWPSVATISETCSGEEISGESSEEDTQSDSALSVKLQLRKDGSRASGAVFLRQEAFLEVELSEESAESLEPPGSSSHLFAASSPTELLSTSSEISLRVNLEKSCSLPCKKKHLARLDSYKLKNGSKKLNKVNWGSETGLAQETVIIERIATEFGEWAIENGLKPEVVEQDVVRELFQFGTMDTASNSISVEIKELVVVPEIVTRGMHPELGERAAFYRQILFDEIAYWRTEKSMAFGRLDPRPYKRPSHTPLKTWTRSGFVPLQLVTGELLFQTLIDSGSLMLEKFVLWMIQNQEVYRPPFLVNCGYFQRVIDKYGGSERTIQQDIATTRALSLVLDKETCRAKKTPRDY